MTTDLITAARIAIERMAYHDRYCVKIGKTTINTRYDGKPTGSPVTFTFRADASRAAYIAREVVKIATADLNAEITRLTSQLEQYKAALERAEKIIKPFADEGAQTEYWSSQSYYSDIGGNLSDFTVGDLRAAYQWIKDRQAKTDGEAS